MYMNSVASGRANRNMRNFVELCREVKVRLNAALRKRKKRSRQGDANMLKETTWKMRPAIRRSLPRVSMLRIVAVAATSPPAPWRVRDTMSQKMKKNVYVLGLK